MKKLQFNLQLFNDGADGVGAPAGDDGNGLDAANQERAITEGHDDAEHDADVSKEVDYETLKKRFKAEFDKDVENILKKRFKEVKGLQNEVEKSKPLMNILASKYGTDNPDELYHAIQQDNAFFEEQAINMGMTTEQYREYLNVTTENRLLHEQLEQQEQKREFQQKFDNWTMQAEQLKTIYPGFDFEEELNNEQFFKIINSGVSLKAAYEAMHSEEIMQGAIAFTAKEVAKKTANNIAKKANRPLEGALLNGAGIIQQFDPRNLTKEQRAEYARRAARGEQISFKIQ